MYMDHYTRKRGCENPLERLHGPCLCTWHIRARLAHQAVSIQICLSLATDDRRSVSTRQSHYHSRRSTKAASIQAQFPSQNLLSRLLSTWMLHPASWRSSSFASFGPQALGWFCGKISNGHKVNTSNTVAGLWQNIPNIELSIWHGPLHKSPQFLHVQYFHVFPYLNHSTSWHRELTFCATWSAVWNKIHKSICKLQPRCPIPSFLATAKATKPTFTFSTSLFGFLPFATRLPCSVGLSRDAQKHQVPINYSHNPAKKLIQVKFEREQQNFAYFSHIFYIEDSEMLELYHVSSVAADPLHQLGIRFDVLERLLSCAPWSWMDLALERACWRGGSSGENCVICWFGEHL